MHRILRTVALPFALAGGALLVVAGALAYPPKVADLRALARMVLT